MLNTKVQGTIIGNEGYTFIGKKGVLVNGDKLIIKTSAGEILKCSYGYGYGYGYVDYNWETKNELMGIGNEKAPLLIIEIAETINGDFTNRKIISIVGI